MPPGEEVQEMARAAEDLIDALAATLAALPPEAREAVRCKLQRLISDFSRLLSITAPSGT
jgi:hypothetical protein